MDTARRVLILLLRHPVSYHGNVPATSVSYPVSTEHHHLIPPSHVPTQQGLAGAAANWPQNSMSGESHAIVHYSAKFPLFAGGELRQAGQSATGPLSSLLLRRSHLFSFIRSIELRVVFRCGVVLHLLFFLPVIPYIVTFCRLILHSVVVLARRVSTTFHHILEILHLLF